MERATGSGSSSSGSAFSCMVRLAPCDLVSSQSGKGYYGKEEVDDLIDLMGELLWSIGCRSLYYALSRRRRALSSIGIYIWLAQLNSRVSTAP